MVKCWNLVGEYSQDNILYGQEKQVEGTLGCLGIYHKAVHETTFAGPTYFSGVLKRFLKQVNNGMRTQSKQYYVLCIFTDGSIHDMEET